MTVKIIAMIPTYNEAGNIEDLVRELRSLSVEALVVDDDSPDGTARIIEGLAENDPGVHLLLRKVNRGRGWAGIDGFKKALDLGADLVVEMDGDRSHAPRYIPAFIGALQNAGADIAIGSRFTAGGKDEERSFVRQAVSAFARNYIAFVLGITVKDPSSGYRLFTRAALEKIIPDLSARDPFIVTEVLYAAKRRGLKVVESPIEFLSRAAGQSKLRPATLFKYLLRVWKLRFSSPRNA